MTNYILYSFRPCIYILVIRTHEREMQWVKNLVATPQKRPLGRKRRGWKYNIKIILNNSVMAWIQLVQYQTKNTNRKTVHKHK
jgi:hypothetical protein